MEVALEIIGRGGHFPTTHTKPIDSVKNQTEGLGIIAQKRVQIRQRIAPPSLSRDSKIKCNQ